MKGYKPLVDGILVRDDFKIERPHPDPCWIIRNEEETASYSDGAGTMFVFSSEELTKAYIKTTQLAGAVVRSLVWDELVDKFGKNFHSVLVDNKGKEGFYHIVPLEKGI